MFYKAFQLASAAEVVERNVTDLQSQPSPAEDVKLLWKELPCGRLTVAYYKINSIPLFEMV